jgi:hypothetical protein
MSNLMKMFRCLGIQKALGETETPRLSVKDGRRLFAGKRGNETTPREQNADAISGHREIAYSGRESDYQDGFSIGKKDGSRTRGAYLFPVLRQPRGFHSLRIVVGDGWKVHLGLHIETGVNQLTDRQPTEQWWGTVNTISTSSFHSGQRVRTPFRELSKSNFKDAAKAGQSLLAGDLGQCKLVGQMFVKSLRQKSFCECVNSVP